jgi:hypothetical protein
MWLTVEEKQAMLAERPSNRRIVARKSEGQNSERPRMSHAAYHKAVVIEKEDLAGLTAQSGGPGFKGHCSIRISFFSHPPHLSKREIMNRGLQAHSTNFISRVGLFVALPYSLSAPVRLLIFVTKLDADCYGVWCAL